jgi:hypothetical protein
VNFSPNRGSGMTLEAFARAHKLPPRWLELREACEEIVRHADFWYRPDLRQQADFATLKWPHFDHYIWPYPNR